MRSALSLFALLFLFQSAWTGSLLAQETSEESLQMGVAVDVVPIGSDFDGTDIVVFGSIENGEPSALKLGHYQVVIKVVGAREDAVVRKKKRILGIWVNQTSKPYKGVPSFYSLASRIPLDRVAERDVLKKHQVGVQNLTLIPTTQGGLEFVLEAPEFVGALRRIKQESGLFSESPRALVQLSPTLFRAAVYLPPNVPIGRHQVTAYLFRNGEYLTETSASFEVRKVGFERWMYNFAHNHSLAYGLLAVLIAIGTGWLANLVFRRK